MIIGKQPGNFAASITINKGEKDGVKADMPVIAKSADFYGLVGKVITVGAGTSIVMPIFNSSFYVSAILEKSNYEGLVNGLGETDPNVIMQYIPKLAKSDIVYGDLVVTSGLGLAFPRGIHIGKVQSIISKYETSMELTIAPVIDFGKLQYVFVIDKGREDGQ
jgi:rod shape-determining protein MreC